MRRLSTESTWLFKIVFPIGLLSVYSFFVISSTINEIFIIVPFLTFGVVAFVMVFIPRWKRLVDFYVDYEKREIHLDNLMGKKYVYPFSQLIGVNYKLTLLEKSVEVIFSDQKRFVFYTKDFWFSEIMPKNERQNIKEEMKQIQTLK